MAYVKYYSRICTNYDSCQSVGARRKLYAKGKCHNCWKRARTEEHRALSDDINPKTGRPYSVKHAQKMRADRLGYGPAERQKDGSLRFHYGITLEQYREMPQQCGICGATECSSGRSLALDHDHRTGVVRGLLCARCNLSLGKFEDSELLLMNAVAYLRRARPALPLRGEH